jgi:hypothetical protein
VSERTWFEKKQSASLGEKMRIILSKLAIEQETLLKHSTSDQQDALFDIIGMDEDEDADVGRRHHDYLYGV